MARVRAIEQHLGIDPKNVGYEQDGTGDQYKRPVLVLRGLSTHVCIIVPLTTSAKRDRFYIDAGIVGKKQAAAIVSQIRLIDTRRLVEKIETMDHSHFECIQKAARNLI